MMLYITKFIEQRCLGYEPKLNKSRWYMRAKFSDGKTREITKFLGEKERISDDDWLWRECQQAERRAG